VGTVSHVLNSPDKVRKERRQRVEAVIESLGYQPSQLARGLRKRTTDLFGVIIPDITNPFFPNVVRGVEDIAYHEGFRLILCNTDNNPVKERIYFNDLKSFQPAGIIVIPSVESMLAKEIDKAHFPVVFVDRCPEWWLGDAVVANNEDGGHQAGEFLIHMGHRVMAAIRGPSSLRTANDRVQGFQRALESAGIQMTSQYIQESAFSSEGGFAATMRLLELEKRPTAIFASSDVLASGALGAVRKMKLRCPEDISIVGFDDLDFANLSAPALTTIYQPGYQMGATACSILLDRVRGAGGKPEQRVLKTELRVRNSVQTIHVSKEPQTKRVLATQKHSATRQKNKAK
jgi:LacI family transcriptional regulator